MNLEIMEDFRNYLESRNMSSNTIHVYLNAVEQFFEIYGCLNHENLLLYKCYLMEHYKTQTVNLRICALNCLAESLHIFTSRIPMIRTQKKSFLDNVISQADYEYLCQCLQRDGNRLYYFLIRFMATTGMRVSEVIKVKVSDVQRGYMDIYSKDNKLRRIYIPKIIREECLAWLNRIGRTKGYIFINRHGSQVTPSAIRGQLNRFAIYYNLDKQVLYPHSFRHLFARNFIEACGDIAMLSDILGHESIQTTRIYLHRSSSEQKKIVNNIVKW